MMSKTIKRLKKGKETKYSRKKTKQTRMDSERERERDLIYIS
jgi:hypothetical protein